MEALLCRGNGEVGIFLEMSCSIISDDITIFFSFLDKWLSPQPGLGSHISSSMKKIRSMIYDSVFLPSIYLFLIPENLVRWIGPYPKTDSMS